MIFKKLFKKWRSNREKRKLLIIIGLFWRVLFGQMFIEADNFNKHYEILKTIKSNSSSFNFAKYISIAALVIEIQKYWLQYKWFLTYLHPRLFHKSLRAFLQFYL